MMEVGSFRAPQPIGCGLNYRAELWARPRKVPTFGVAGVPVSVGLLGT